MALPLAATLLLAGLTSAQSCPNGNLTLSYPAPKAADGWTYRVVAQGLTKPRGLVFDSDGHLVVVDSGAGLVRFEIDGGCVGANTTIVENEDLNHGLQISEDGETLYASTESDVYSWPYSSNLTSLANDDRRTLVTNMSNSDHTTRTLLLSRMVPGTLLVSRGSDSNVDEDAEDIESGHSQIRRFNISSLAAGDDPFKFLDGEVLGWGLRNSVGVAEHPSTGGIWSVENSIDELRRNGEDIHQDNPGEEMNFHGYLESNADGVKSNQQGGNYGYPQCFAIWSTNDFPDLGDMTTGDQVPGAEEGNVTDESCNDNYVKPALTFQAHTAPLDIKFSSNGSEAFVAFHGSWDRTDPVGYNIARISFNEDGQPVASSDSRDGAVPILSTPDLSKCPDDCFRPAGLAWDSEGRLWFTSDSTGEIFVLERSQGSDEGSDGGDSGGDGGDDNSGDDDNAAAGIKVAGWSMALCALVAGAFLA